MKRRLVWYFVFLIPLFYISMGHMLGAPLSAVLLGHENAVSFGLTQLLLTLPIMYINDKYYRVGFKTLWNRAPTQALTSGVAVLVISCPCVFSRANSGLKLPRRFPVRRTDPRRGRIKPIKEETRR